MTQETSSASPLTKQARNAGYYAGLVYGVGYLLTFIGIIVVAVEILVRIPSSVWSMILPYIPAWVVAGLICYLIALIFGAVLGGSIIRNAKNARSSGLSLDMISSSVTAFSLMVLFAGIGSIIMIGGATPTYFPTIASSLTYPIVEIVGAILMLIGFRSYRGKQADSKLVGAILMLISVILIYIIAYIPLREGWAYLSITTFPLTSAPPLPGILLSEAILETVALIIGSVCALLFAILAREGGTKRSVVGIVLSAACILFAIGLLYFNFSTVMLLSKMLPYTGSTMITLWIVFFGFLILGISGIVVIVAACLSIAVLVKQLSLQPTMPAAPPSPPVPPPPSQP